MKVLVQVSVSYFQFSFQLASETKQKLSFCFNQRFQQYAPCSFCLSLPVTLCGVNVFKPDLNAYHPAGFILKALLCGVFLTVLQPDFSLASHSCPFPGIRLLEIHVAQFSYDPLWQLICRGMRVNQKVPSTTFESAPIWLPSFIK